MIGSKLSEFVVLITSFNHIVKGCDTYKPRERRDEEKPKSLQVPKIMMTTNDTCSFTAHVEAVFEVLFGMFPAKAVRYHIAYVEYHKEYGNKDYS